MRSQCKPRGGRIGIATLIAVAACAAAAPSLAQGRRFVVAQASEIESCVNESAIRFEPGDRRDTLDPTDAAAVAKALLRRYPAVGQDGFAPDHIVLWRKPGAGWLYVTLIANPAKAEEVCFTASFVAERFEFTGALVKKYFGVDS